MTRDRYKTRLAKSFDFIGLELGVKGIEHKARVFAKRKRGSNWVLNNILKFVQYQKNSVHRKEITGATIRNYVKSPFVTYSRGLCVYGIHFLNAISF